MKLIPATRKELKAIKVLGKCEYKKCRRLTRQKAKEEARYRQKTRRCSKAVWTPSSVSCIKGAMDSVFYRSTYKKWNRCRTRRCPKELEAYRRAVFD